MGNNTLLPPGIQIRPFQDSDREAIVSLNHQFVEVLSPMDKARFDSLKEICSLLLVAQSSPGDEVVGFIMAFAADAGYDSSHFHWFKKRYDNFLYIDRVVVSGDFRSLGIARHFYAEAAAWARAHSINHLLAEIDMDPPNLASLKFHQRFGFVEVATHRIGPGKALSRQQLELGL